MLEKICVGLQLLPREDKSNGESVGPESKEHSSTQL